MTDTMAFFLLVNGMYLAAAFPSIAVIFLIFRFRLTVTAWYITDLLGVLLPGPLYWMMDEMELDEVFRYFETYGGNGWANLIWEPIGIGIACSLVFLWRSRVGRKYPTYSKRVSLCALVVMIMVTLAIYLFTPELPGE